MNRFTMLVLVAIGLVLGGCSGLTTAIKDKGSYFLEFGTRVEAGAEASATSGTESTSTLKLLPPEETATVAPTNPE